MLNMRVRVARCSLRVYNDEGALPCGWNCTEFLGQRLTYKFS